MRVLVTRPKEDAERIAAPLRALGATVVNEPMLVIMPVAGPNVDLDGVQAVLLTSANGARALGAAVDRRDISVYAVGDQTARAAREQGFVTVHSAQGDVAALAALVARDLDPDAGELVHAAGSTRAGDLAGALTEHGFKVRVARLYDARPTAALSKDLQATLQAGDLDAAVFFSPRTARIFIEHVRDGDLTEGLEGMTAYALSPAVARELDGVPFTSVRIADEPSLDALLAMMEADIRDGTLVAKPKATPPETESSSADESDKDDVGQAAIPHADTEADATDASTAQEAVSDAPGPDEALEDQPEAAVSADATDHEAPAPSAAEDDTSNTSVPSDATESEAEANTADDDKAAGEDRCHEDGDAAYGGSSGREQPAPETPSRTEEEAQKERRALGKFVTWIVVLLLLAGGAFGSMPWWKPMLPPAYQALLPTYPEPRDPPVVSELRVRLDTLSEEVTAIKARLAKTREQSQAGTTASAGAIADLTARIVALEEQQANGGPSSPAPQQDIAPSLSIADLETAIGEAVSPLIGQVSALTTGAESTKNTIGTLRSHLDGLRSDLNALSTRLDDVSDTIPRTDPRAVALLIQVSLLRERIADGRPYADALAPVLAAPTLDPSQDDALATLSAHADSGVPTLEALRRDFEPMSIEVAQNAFVPEGQAWWKSTLASIMSSITVRRTDGVPTDGTIGYLSQAAARIAENDLAGAVTALGPLDGAAAQAAEPWLTKARTHLAVDAALSSLTSAALKGIGAAQTTE